MGVKVQQKKGTKDWYLVIHRNNQRKTKKIGSKAAAEAAKKEVEKALALEDLGIRSFEKPKAPLLRDYYEDFKQAVVRGLKPNTQAIYTNNFTKHILPVLGHLPLDRITRMDIEKFVTRLVDEPVTVERKKGYPKKINLARPTIRMILANLKTCLNHAVEHEVIPKNPATRLTKLYKHAPERTTEIQPLNEKEVCRFLTAVAQNSSKHYALFLCALHTGMRSGELAGLQWDDIHFEERYLFVRRQVVWNIEQTTKGNAMRRIDLSNALVQALLALKKQRREEYLKNGQNEIPKWVFCNEEGKPADMPNIKARHFKARLKDAKLRPIRFHDLRHTFATLLIQNGEPLAYVQNQLGHSTIKLTVDTYTHWMPGKNREAMDRLPSVGIAGIS